jgi:hypothetical protein
MTCEQFTPIGTEGYGFCHAHNCHVSTLAYEALHPFPPNRCLCDYCKPGADGKKVIDQDVFFHGHDLVGLKSVEKELFKQRVAEAAGMKCAVPVPKLPKPVPNKAPKPPAFRKPQKPQPTLF